MTNCFVVHAGGPACWVVDAGFTPQPLIDFVRSSRFVPSMVLLTHAHVDHIAGLHDVRQEWPQVPIAIHEGESSFLTHPGRNLSIMLPEPVVAPVATDALVHGQRLALDGHDFEVRHTPGHSPGGVTIYHAKGDVAIVGDTLFAGSIGRTDFPTSDHAQLMASIEGELLTLPNHTRIVPGHGPESTIGSERASNPFLGDM